MQIITKCNNTFINNNIFAHTTYVMGMESPSQISDWRLPQK